jgi:hypothetical protein
MYSPHTFGEGFGGRVQGKTLSGQALFIYIVSLPVRRLFLQKECRNLASGLGRKSVPFLLLTLGLMNNLLAGYVAHRHYDQIYYIYLTHTPFDKNPKFSTLSSLSHCNLC